MEVILGTANFGKEYGHRSKLVSQREIHKILMKAYNLGITKIETAFDYNCLEQLGELGRNFELIFKCDTLQEAESVRDWRGKVTLMKHHRPYKEMGKYSSAWKHWSIYDASDIPKFMDWKPESIEVPFNIVDQRFRRGSNLIREHYEGGGSSNPRSYARSVFIQGLAFSMPDFHGIPFYHLCWNLVRNNPNIDGIVVGVDSAKQLEDIMNIPQYEIDYSKIGQEGWFKCL